VVYLAFAQLEQRLRRSSRPHPNPSPGSGQAFRT
jgi:hypothetical protein